MFDDRMNEDLVWVQLDLDSIRNDVSTHGLIIGVFIEVAQNPTLRIPLIWRSESLPPCVYLASDQEFVGVLVCNRKVNESASVLASLDVIG